MENVPRHVAIIMDGNGRWAKERGLPRVAGHQQGVEAAKRCVKAARELGVEFLTLFAFSTENWDRPRDEVSFLMELPIRYLNNDVEELIKNNVRLRLIGDTMPLPATTKDAFQKALARTAGCTGLTLALAINYGGRADITNAVKEIARRAQRGELSPDEVNQETVDRFLYTTGLPPVDLLIRPGGEKRLSNFLLWQLAYSELYFSDILWPDFTGDDFSEAVRWFAKRERRFGRIR